MLHYTQTPVQEIVDPTFKKAGVRVLIKREDLNHPLVSGNKWWKLKYNLEEAKKQEKKTILTFGGAYSNHIYATAAATDELGFNSMGIIRGEETFPLNRTLSFAMSKRMHLHFISRETYRKKNDREFISDLHTRFGDFYLIPEGGTNELAVKGVTEFAQNLLTETSFDILCLPVGTGGTMAGLITGFEGKKNIIGFSVLKGGEFLNDEIENLLPVKYSNWKLITDYHAGGYAKISDELISFMRTFKSHHSLVIEHIYTGKMFFGLFDLIKKGYFSRGTTIFAVHTGGLQS